MIEPNKIYNMDCLEGMRQMADNSVDTIITDPPYGLKFMGKKWDYEIPSVVHFKEMFRVAKCGSTLLCFGGTRTWHRIAVNIEDAGWEIRDTICWMYGSGFPKAYDISKGIDNKFGAEREVIGKKECGYQVSISKSRVEQGYRPNETCATKEVDITSPTTSEAKLWEGWKSHALKPAFEPIIVAMKPNEGTYVENALKWGVAGLNIDGGRIGTETLNNSYCKKKEGYMSDEQGASGGAFSKDGMNIANGRFPANVILDEESGEMLDAQAPKTGADDGITFYNAGLKGASRFFYCAKSSKSERNKGCEELPDKIGGGMKGTEDKTLLTGSGNERNNITKNFHPTVKPLSLMKYLCILTKTPTGGIVLDPFMGSGTTALASIETGRQFIGFEISEEYCKIAEARIAATQPPLMAYEENNE